MYFFLRVLKHTVSERIYSVLNVQLVPSEKEAWPSCFQSSKCISCFEAVSASERLGEQLMQVAYEKGKVIAQQIFLTSCDIPASWNYSAWENWGGRVLCILSPISFNLSSWPWFSGCWGPSESLEHSNTSWTPSLVKYWIICHLLMTGKASSVYYYLYVHTFFLFTSIQHFFNSLQNAVKDNFLSFLGLIYTMKQLRTIIEPHLWVSLHVCRNVA